MKVRHDTLLSGFLLALFLLVSIYSRNDADVGDSCLTSQRRSWAFFHVGKPYNLAFSRIIVESTANFTSRIVLPWNNNGKAVTTVYPTGSVLNKGAFVFIKNRSRRSKSPCAYYANSTATFHPLLEGDLVFKLNSGPSQQSINSTHFGTSF